VNRDEDGKRQPPAFQEYAADLLALEAIRTMSMAERGLLATMRWACWVNDELPADRRQLARVLGVDLRTLRAHLTRQVCAFFAPKPGDESRLICPELAEQKLRLIARRERLSEAGREGREKQLLGRTTPQATPQTTPRASPKLQPGPSEKSREEQNPPLEREEPKPALLTRTREEEEQVISYRRAFGEIP